MLPKYHIAIGFIFSTIVFFIFPEVTWIGAGLIFFSSVLIDVDHYVYYFFKKKDLSLRKAVNYFLEGRKKISGMEKSERKKFYSGFCFLHGIEVIILLVLLGLFISKYFLFILIGIMLHLFLDITEEIYLGARLDKISIVYDWFKFRRLKILN